MKYSTPSGPKYSLCIVSSARIFKRLNCVFLVYVAPSTKAMQCWLA